MRVAVGHQAHVSQPIQQAFERVDTPLKLALVGDAPYAHEYIRRVRDTRDPRVVIPGAIYGDGYRELGSNCFAYIHATEVGGTHPALIEAMGRGALVLYRNTPENAEVAGDAGIGFEPGELSRRIEALLTLAQDCQHRARVAGLEALELRSLGAGRRLAFQFLCSLPGVLRLLIVVDGYACHGDFDC